MKQNNFTKTLYLILDHKVKKHTMLCFLLYATNNQQTKWLLLWLCVQFMVSTNWLRLSILILVYVHFTSIISLSHYNKFLNK